LSYGASVAAVSDDRSELLLIGGRSGVGKSSVAAEMHAQLARRQVKHCWIEGDNLDLAYPRPWEHRLAEANLRAIWANYRRLGYRRLIYTNTVSVRHAEELTAALGDSPRTTAVLLTASDETARERLTRREIGGALDVHLERSTAAARELDGLPPRVLRVPTDARSVADIAAEVVRLIGWA
jgi:hypothetical protein